MDKAAEAFRTISEVAELLETPAHVLRFWESRFPQIRPVKRAGGRRYYRPADVALLTGIKRLLHDEGLTIRGVQKILREQGVRHVAGLSGEPLPDDIEMDAEAALEAALAANFGGVDDDPIEPARAETATIVALETALRRGDWDRPTTDRFGDTVPAAVADLFASPAARDVSTDPWQPVVPAPALAQHQRAGDASPGESSPQPIAIGDLAAALRALPAHALLRRHDQAAALRDRLIALRQTLLAPPIFAKP